MMNLARGLALLLLLLSASFAQDDPKAREERIRKRVEEALDRELARLHDSLADAVRSEFTGSSLDRALGAVTEDLLRKHATFLASDELEGRNAGYPGELKAAEYIAGIMQRAGLKPVGDKDRNGDATYYQHFKIFDRTAQNCLGLVEGTDPELKDEIVVIGAHHDHVGLESQNHWGRLGRAKDGDTIWNGADDNGSGTSTVLSLIKAFGEGGVRCRRSILFMTFSGEEGGLLGSAYYVRHPFVPIDRHVFMLNLDMVGRNPEKPVEIHGVGSADGGVIREAVQEAVDKARLDAKLFDKVQLMGGDSDHTSFKNMRVPFTFFFTGFHADYHKVSDTADKLAYGNMVKVARAAAHIVVAIGNAAKRPVFSGKGGGNDFNFGDPARPGPARRTFGITKVDVTDDDLAALGLDPTQGGIKVESVTPGSAADKAGVRPGDLVLSVAGLSFTRANPLADLRRALDKVEAGKETLVVVLRDKERTTLKAVWDK